MRGALRAGGGMRTGSAGPDHREDEYRVSGQNHHEDARQKTGLVI